MPLRYSLFGLLVACMPPAAQPTPAPPPAPAPARDPADIARIHALEERVATLEARIQAFEREDADREARLAAQLGSPRPRLALADPLKTYLVPLDDSPSIGPSDAPITVVAALQFPEPYTHRVLPTLMQLRAAHRRDLRIVVKLFVVHPHATDSSYAGCAAAYQNALDTADSAIWDAAMDPPGQGLRQLDPAELREIARGLRLDLRRFDEDLASCKAGYARDLAMLKKLGMTGVPMFWINGRPLTGAQPIDAFERVIGEELARWQAAGKPAGWYAKLQTGAPDAP